jgi:hypothetical protein
LVGRNNWIALTKDKRIRYLPLERQAIQTYKIWQFSFSSGTMSGNEMAATLKNNLNGIFRFLNHQAAPFVAALLTNTVVLRDDFSQNS